MRHRAGCVFFLSVSLFTSSLAQSKKESAFIFDTTASSQLSDTLCAWDYSPDDSSFINLQYFLPAVFRDESALKRYIRDPRFLQLRAECGDTMAVDLIFEHAMDIADGTVSHALLIAALATFDHFRLGVKIPLLGTLYIPLTIVETEQGYSQRFSHLPRHVLPDSIGQRKRDRDKLQHFFGSAYLTYIFDSKSIARAIGDFIENDSQKGALDRGGVLL